ncbi:hypothetical protein DV096_05840 [Bradymonadaceae bacterium TMQ3]|uniref:AtpZ/AtpI family protein n=1 Tax=Lujinxingia sediminis TaxID=2480984 RepID=A0ABY0CWA2_9DELT|nr:AtpZ/AtpI family protein [Lujinxingia sediminis]RDV40078.1 hypothetical protein DV096_05840 [Bradymonadaceae bacterium TMQ3]RVU47875.1 AtpZ/AtpI family protein [Lujinxingia sediminis]TXC77177.1 AtpZ/AtpI family protein [Bradymonadales bacterium TMQ1]
MASPPEDESRHSTRNPWLVAGAIGALGFEFVGLVLGGAFIGTRLDAHFETAPVLLLVSMAVAMLSAGWHVWKISQRFLKTQGED